MPGCTRPPPGWAASSGPIAAAEELGAELDRTVGAKANSQNWLQFPVSGISPEDAEAFVSWLDRCFECGVVVAIFIRVSRCDARIDR